MSIFNKSITTLVTADLQELLTEQAVENIRLEFKGISPSKDEMLKKLSSFANTYGGYVVVGATEDGKGRFARPARCCRDQRVSAADRAGVLRRRMATPRSVRLRPDPDAAGRDKVLLRDRGAPQR